MKITVSADQLQKHLSFVSHAVSVRSQLPVLSHILIEAKDGRVTLCATDLEIGIETSFSVNVEKTGGITIPAKLFLDLINSFPAEDIILLSDETKMTIKGKKIRSNIQGMNKEEFPSLYEERGELILTLPAERTKKYLSRVVFAAAVDTTKPALNGVLFQKKEDELHFVATDGVRLSLQKVAIQKESMVSDKALIIPARVMKEVLNLREDISISLFAAFSTNQILFEQGENILLGRLIEANYPPYEKIIPVDFSTKVVFDRQEMQKAIKTAAIFARETANIIKLSFKQDRIIISANTPAIGENVVEVEAKLHGEENEIAFNAKYLLDLFANIDDETMSFEMTGPLNPGVFKIAEDASFLHLIMPIRV